MSILQTEADRLMREAWAKDPDIRAAIIAERERCAKIADSVARGGTLALKGISTHLGTASAIAEAIRESE
jgi:hypothetical protein